MVCRSVEPRSPTRPRPSGPRQSQTADPTGQWGQQSHVHAGGQGAGRDTSVSTGGGRSSTRQDCQQQVRGGQAPRAAAPGRRDAGTRCRAHSPAQPPSNQSARVTTRRPGPAPPRSWRQALARVETRQLAGYDIQDAEHRPRPPVWDPSLQGRCGRGVTAVTGRPSAGEGAPAVPCTVRAIQVEGKGHLRHTPGHRSCPRPAVSRCAASQGRPASKEDGDKGQ